MRKKLSVLTALLPLLLSAAVELPEVKISDITPSGGYTVSTPQGISMNGAVYVHNGKTKKYEVITPGKVESGDNTETVTFKAGQADITVKFSARTRMILAELTVYNPTDKEVFLEPGLSLTVPRTEKDYFYDGYAKFPIDGKNRERAGFKGGPSVAHLAVFAAPVSLAIYGDSSRSFTLGSVMYDKYSYICGGVNKFTKDNANLYYSCRTALGPKRKTTFRFIIGAVENKFGWEENSIQAMYDSFPEKWTPYVGQDNKYIWYAHGMYRAWTYKPDYEVFRRYFMAWDWAYAPYKRSGDIYGHKELWDYKPLLGKFRLGYINQIVGGEFGPFDWNKLSWEDFHKNRKGVFHKYGKKFGFAFYPTASGTFCDWGLVQSNYQDSFLPDTKGGAVAIFKTGWTNYHDPDARVFPLGTSFAKQFYKDLKLVYDELDLPGFSFDCSGSGCYYRGPAVKNYDLPGRAYDTQGVYIDAGVAQYVLFDYIHEKLNPEAPLRERPFIAANGTTNADVIMIERTPFERGFHDKMPQWRHTFGSLPIIIHGKGYMLPYMIPDWRSITRKEFLKRLGKLMDYATFVQFRYGMTSSAQLYAGNATILYTMPELLECIRLGWQVVNPVACDNGGKVMYQARYGRKENTILFYGNPYDEPMPAQYEVSNDVLGKDVYLFVRQMRDKANLTNTIGGRQTFFNFELPSRIPVLFEAVCGFSSLPDGDVDVSSAKELNKQVFTIKFSNSSSFTADIKPREVRTFAPAQVAVNGRKVTDLNNVEFPENAVVTLTYNSNDFKNTQDEINSFPFLNAQKQVDFAVVVPADADKETLALADNFREYFDFCAKNKLCKAGKVQILRSIPKNKPYILLDFKVKDPAKLGVSRKGNVLTVAAKDSYAGDILVRNLCHIMDRRFEYFFGMGPTDGCPVEMLEKFNFRGKYLPVKRCFETGDK